MLSDAEITGFISAGFVAVRGAVPEDVVGSCVATIADELRGRGVDLTDRSTWGTPVERIGCPDTPAFVAAGTQRVLWETYDQLLGEGTWRKRAGVGGTIPVRFPHPNDPGDAAWHIDGSWDQGGTYWVNVRSRRRGLLCLFLFSDVGPNDAPTELKIGSHLDVPAVLEPYGDSGTPFGQVAPALPASTLQRPSAVATGHAGDVFVCHPFIVHRATWPHHGERPRILAQPEVGLLELFGLDPAGSTCPVEQAILAGLKEQVPLGPQGRDEDQGGFTWKGALRPVRRASHSRTR